MNTSRVLRNMAGLAFALLLLVPVPALALTFLGSWNFFSATTGGGGSDIVNGTFHNNSDNPNNYGLTIGMGFVNPPSTITKYSVTATRDFQITSDSQLISIAHSFGSFLDNGSISATLSIQRYGVANDPFNFPPYSVTTPPGTFVGTNLTRFGRLTLGLYRLSLTITYMRTPPNGSWNNSSPHTFTFLGL
ncbi:MAG TPA: hypothetical protein PLN21_19930 [Gemmatales bacterium]|nr:hypothetical protein [Gemmatales bacterium]